MSWALTCICNQLSNLISSCEHSFESLLVFWANIQIVGIETATCFVYCNVKVDFTCFFNDGWSCFHWKLCHGHFVFCISIVCAIDISLFSTNTKLQVDVDPPSTDIFSFSFCWASEGISRNIFIWHVASMEKTPLIWL